MMIIQECELGYTKRPCPNYLRSAAMQGPKVASAADTPSGDTPLEIARQPQFGKALGERLL